MIKCDSWVLERSHTRQFDQADMQARGQAHQDERRIVSVYLPNYRRVIECTKCKKSSCLASLSGKASSYENSLLNKEAFVFCYFLFFNSRASINCSSSLDKCQLEYGLEKLLAGISSTRCLLIKLNLLSLGFGLCLSLL